MRSVAVEEADEREKEEAKASQAASDKAKADEKAADKEKEGKGETVVKRPIPDSAIAAKEFVMPKFLPDREPENSFKAEAEKKTPFWRAPDDALKTMRQQKETKDESWIDTLPERMFK